MSAKITSEREFEDSIVAYLCEYGGYELGLLEHWSRELALDAETLLQFVQDTQAEAWGRLKAIHGHMVEEKFLARLHRELDNRGMLDVLRHGIVDYGVRFKVAYFRPANTLNTQTLALYKSNRLTILRQVPCHSKRPNDTVDLVLCVNGLPTATVELKTPLTGQTHEDAITQYQSDRDPRELLFAFKRRALVHFAVSPDEAAMTTRLLGAETRFLPFNRGHDNGAGNPPNPNGCKTSYLWERIWTAPQWLELLGSYLHLQSEDVAAGSRMAKKETLIFPRFHQLDAVQKLMATSQAEGVGQNYLIQHSAGSGKSNTIGWLAHSLSQLHNVENEVVFSVVIVVSDRRVLDRQLQETIYQFEHRQGLVQPITRDAAQLAKALDGGVKVIVTTLQKFPFVLDRIGSLPARNYAVIVDEAHSSQTGDAADALKRVLRGEKPREENAEEEESEEWDTTELQAFMEARRARQPNISFFAFTATPKPKTLWAFGRPGTDGQPAPWHLYSMRQAIEEGFILDVLRGYINYKMFFRLSKAVEDDPQLSKRAARRAMMRFVLENPRNREEKARIIVEHFRSVVASKIGGKAKAMVVCASRKDAVAMFGAVREALQDAGETKMQAFVAFSGVVSTDEGDDVTEMGLNGFSERKLPLRFAKDEGRLLVVADKYQTGFDQPLLAAMYVDKRLAGVRAVQTLSRLNRIHPGKDETFVLDFVNDPDTIEAAFQPFFEEAKVEGEIDPNRLFDLQRELMAFQVLSTDEIEAFATLFFGSRDTTQGQNSQLHASLDSAVARFDELQDEDKEEFKHLLSTFVRLHGFVSQIMPFMDGDLEKLYVYARHLSAKIADPLRSQKLNLGDELALEFYRLEKLREGALELKEGQTASLKVGSAETTSADSDNQERLSLLIDDLNQRFNTDFTPGDQLFFDQIEVDLLSDETLSKQAQSNTIDNFRFPFEDGFMGKFIERTGFNQEIVERLLNDNEFYGTMFEHYIRRVYGKLKKE